MSGIKYYALKTGEEPPIEFVVIRHVDGEPEFVASYVNSSYLSYENGVLLKMHERSDALRAENVKLRKLMNTMRKTLDSAESDVCSHCDLFGNCADNDWHECEFDKRMRELGVEVDE